MALKRRLGGLRPSRDALGRIGLGYAACKKQEADEKKSPHRQKVPPRPERVKHRANSLSHGESALKGEPWSGAYTKILRIVRNSL